MALEKIKKIISEQFALSEDDITEDTVIMEDLDADSLDLIDLAMSLEDCFEVEVPDEELENFKTVGDIVKYIEEM
ncbi:MAG: acyl carrier protein [Clostridia bacterium]|nr:acyl carrier protein [Clostridia bacterium]